MMNFRFFLLLSCLVPALSMMAATADTVKVINNPGKVTVIKKNGEVKLNVAGIDGDAGKTYTYTVKTDDDEDYDVDGNTHSGKGIVFNRKKCAASDSVPHFDVFISGLYLGWGHTNAAGEHHGTTGKTFEVGVLNVVGLAYHFGDRNRLSLGVGYQAKYHELKKSYTFASPAENELTIEPFPADYKKTLSQLVVHSVQFPLLYAKGFGKKFWAYGGGVMNWNFYASYDSNYKNGRTRVNTNTKGLSQRKITFDALVGVQWNNLGVYFRYSPQSIFKDGYGPKLNKSWTLGLAVGF